MGIALLSALAVLCACAQVANVRQPDPEADRVAALQQVSFYTWNRRGVDETIAMMDAGRLVYAPGEVSYMIWCAVKSGRGDDIAKRLLSRYRYDGGWMVEAEGMSLTRYLAVKGFPPPASTH